jgi:hypothetical protein
MLHGKIEVNGVAIGYWEAQRTTPIFKDLNHYGCKFFYRNMEGHPLHAEFVLTHFERIGAPVLAAAVITKGMKDAKGYPPGQPIEFPV